MTGGPAGYLAQSLQLVLGAVFLAAAVAKLRRPFAFVAAVRGYELVPDVLSGTVAAGLILVESLVAVSLLTGWQRAVGVPTAGLLLLGFAVAVGINLKRGRAVSCGCFGSASERISPRTLVRIGGLLAGTVALAVIQVVWRPSPLNAVDVAQQGMAGVERLMVTAALGTFLFVVAAGIYHLPEIRELLRRLPSQA